MATTESGTGSIQTRAVKKREAGELATWVLLLAIAFCCTAVGRNLWDSLGPPSRRARIVCYDRAFDFQEAKPGSEFSHEFVIENPSHQDLSLAKVTPDCGCVSVQLPTEKLPAESSLRLPIKISLKGLPSGTRLSKRIVVEADDSTVDKLVLEVFGFVK